MFLEQMLGRVGQIEMVQHWLESLLGRVKVL